MNSRASAYPVLFAAVLVGMLLAGAMAVSLILTGDPAYPVKVFGNARTPGAIGAIASIRPEDHPALPQGRVDERQLLPLPPPPKWTVSAGALAAADPVYRAMAAFGRPVELDRARLAAQRGRHAEAIRLYEQLGSKFPGMRGLLMERANVLASFGEHGMAVNLLRSQLNRYPRDVEVRMLAAHNAWWSNQPLVADSLVGLALAIEPGSADALRLRHTVRAATSPPLAIARQWVRSGGSLEQLIFARALVREQHYAEAIRPYRLALDSAALRSDSLLLEAASAAAAADSLPAMERLTSEYLAMRPGGGDDEALLRLARAYSWRGDYDNALKHYARVANVGGRDSVRMEVAQVLVWSGREHEAERELRVVVAREPRNAEALKLLGDLSSWHGKWTEAEAYYSRAREVAPDMPGLTEAMVVAAKGRERDRLASLARGNIVPNASDVAFEAFADNQKFRWASTRASRSFKVGDAAVRAIAQQNVFEGEPTGALSRNPGLSGRLEGTVDLWRGSRLELLAGAENYPGVTTFPVYGLGLAFDDVLGTGIQLGLDARHQPAAMRVASLVALQARTASDVLSVTASKNSGPWAFWTRAEYERLQAIVGEARRAAAAASVTRSITERLSASVSVSALTFDRAAPVLRGWGNLFWAPERFVEPVAGLTYRVPLSESLVLTSGANLGYGFARERSNDRRYGTGATPTGGALTDVAYMRGPWHVGVGASVGGALGNGYRAGSLRAQASYRFGTGR